MKGAIDCNLLMKYTFLVSDIGSNLFILHYDSSKIFHEMMTLRKTFKHKSINSKFRNSDFISLCVCFNPLIQLKQNMICIFYHARKDTAV